MKTADVPIHIVKGEGALLWDNNDNTYIDAISSWWTNIHGHANPYIAEKMHAQLLQLEHVIFAGFTHTPAETLAERLIENHLPKNQKKVFFSDNGSTAVEVAIKMALQYWFN
ncbi:MAG: aminotransferase class III-fold pyridoxal phosphate-dependent enzyme, partial [Chitinophagales bacterium]|nr:aminotransferase class III-fold pyridoxal phosphate-dependent enzyme [Chitinophagales bacterium]